MPYLSIININQSTESGWKVCFQVAWIARINIDIPFLGTINRVQIQVLSLKFKLEFKY